MNNTPPQFTSLSEIDVVDHLQVIRLTGLDNSLITHINLSPKTVLYGFEQTFIRTFGVKAETNKNTDVAYRI